MAFPPLVRWNSHFQWGEWERWIKRWIDGHFCIVLYCPLRVLKCTCTCTCIYILYMNKYILYMHMYILFMYTCINWCCVMFLCCNAQLHTLQLHCLALSFGEFDMSRTCTCTCTCVHVHVHVYMYMCICMYTCMYMQQCSVMCAPVTLWSGVWLWHLVWPRRRNILNGGEIMIVLHIQLSGRIKYVVLWMWL